MALLERVSTLVRANINDLIDQAEDPEKMLKQVILDMQNQLLQLKTQVAVAAAGHHLLMKKQQEHEQAAADWMRKAELAVEKQQEELARTALERSVSARNTAGRYNEQVADQNVQVENLKSALTKLEGKLVETQARCEMLVAQNRRARAVERAGDARLKLDDNAASVVFDRMKNKVQQTEAFGAAKAELLNDSVDDQFAHLEKQTEVDRLLAEIKSRRAAQ